MNLVILSEIFDFPVKKHDISFWLSLVHDQDYNISLIIFVICSGIYLPVFNFSVSEAFMPPCSDLFGIYA